MVGSGMADTSYFRDMPQSFFNNESTKHFRRELRNAPTHAETEMWHGLRARRAGGFKFRRQHGIGPFIVDFYCPELRLAVEVDGATHDDPVQQEYDARRTAHIESNGIHVIRFTDGEVLWSVDQCVEKIFEWVRGRGLGE